MPIATTSHRRTMTSDDTVQITTGGAAYLWGPAVGAALPV